MIVQINTIPEIQDIIASNKSSLGFVPTMGNLHDGHLSLLKASLLQNDTTIISIFVNPKQFGPNEDFQKYPRTLEEDKKKIQLLSDFNPDKKIIVFTPDYNTIYPDNFQTTIRNSKTGSILEGAIRPDHFEGVLTVVYRLLRIVNPTHLYMGLKDYQQFLLIKTMITDFNLPTQIHGLPTIRDHEGLALSSRNQYLSPQDKKEALVLPKTLNDISDKWNLEKNFKIITDICFSIQQKNPSWEYLELRDEFTLMSPNNNQNLILLGAYRIKSVRLIDNIKLR